MDPDFLRYYNTELQHIRESGAEFAEEFPKIAGRLGLEEFECADPYVERLLEGFAFLAARLQLKIDREFPKFTEHLLDIIYPHYLRPTPSMAVATFNPNLNDSALADGHLIKSGSALRSQIGSGEQTACEFRTTRDLKLWPLELKDARYLASRGDFGSNTQLGSDVRAGLQLDFQLGAGVTVAQLKMDQLDFYVRGASEASLRVLEQIHANCTGIIVRTGKGREKQDHWIDSEALSLPGYADTEAIIPLGLRSFRGYRFLLEYFAFAAAFQFTRIEQLGTVLTDQETHEFSLFFCFGESDPLLINSVGVEQFALHCVPIVNLFPKRCDRIHVTPRSAELHVVPDRTRPMDFEVHSLTQVMGYTESQEDFELRPFYWSNDKVNAFEEQAFYTTRRHQRRLSAKQLRDGPRSSYIGSEFFVMPCDAGEAPFPRELRQLAMESMCTNRDLPLMMPVGQGDTDFSLVEGAPIKNIRCVAGPTAPRPALASGDTAWRLISHLSLNYLSLFDPSEGNSAASLRELLELYIDRHDSVARRQVSSITSIQCARVVRRVPMAGPMTAARGLEVTVTIDETGFEGSGILVIGKMLEEFFAKFVSINSFTETVICSKQRGEVMRWPVRLGRRQTI